MEDRTDGADAAPADYRESMREGVRAEVRWLAKKREKLSGLKSDALPGLLYSAAIVGTIAPVSGLGGNLGAAVAGAFAAIGIGYTAERLGRKAEQLRGRGGEVPAPEEMAEEISAEVQRDLHAGDGLSEARRAEVSEVLRGIGAVEVAVREAISLGNHDLVKLIFETFEDLDTRFTDFGWALNEIRDCSHLIMRQIHQQGAESRRRSEQQESMETLLRAILRQLGPAGRGREPAPAVIDGSPYKGLEAFRERDAMFFFGREDLVDKLITRLSRCLTDTGLVVVTGASGAGKSSLIQAGLLPGLAKGDPAIPGVERWPRRTMTPLADPLDQLAACVAALATPDAVDAMQVRASLASHPESFNLAVRQAVEASGHEPSARLLLVVDQFEQIFTSEGQEHDRAAFITALHAAASRPAGTSGTPPALVIICVRSDFRDRCADYGLLQSAVHDDFHVGAMLDPEIRRAISEPAKAAGAVVDPDLTDALLRELGGWSGTVTRVTAAAGALPLLSQALAETWDRREGNHLTVAAYGKTGGITRALANSAEDAYSHLDAEGKRLAQQVFVQLASVREDGSEVGTPLALSRIETLWPAAAESVLAVIGNFALRRLLTVDAGSVQLAHESLIQGWSQLSDWLSKDREFPGWRTWMETRVRRWEKSGYDHGSLLRGSELEEAEKYCWTRPGVEDRIRGYVCISRLVQATMARSVAEVRRDAWLDEEVIDEAISIYRRLVNYEQTEWVLRKALYYRLTVRTRPLEAMRYWKELRNQIMSRSDGLASSVRRAALTLTAPYTLTLSITLTAVALGEILGTIIALGGLTEVFKGSARTNAHFVFAGWASIVITVGLAFPLWRACRTRRRHPILALPFLALLTELMVFASAAGFPKAPFPLNQRWACVLLSCVVLLGTLAILRRPGWNRAWPVRVQEYVEREASRTGRSRRRVVSELRERLDAGNRR